MRLSCLLKTAQQSEKINVGTTSVDRAREYAVRRCESEGKDLDTVLPNFDDGYHLLQSKIRRAHNIPRAEMPVIRQRDIENFSRYLTEQGVKNSFVPTAAKDLLPTQSQIWLDKTVTDPLQHGRIVSGDPRLNLTITTSKEWYILDGHHRFAAMLLTDPHLKIRTLHVELGIDDLVKIANEYMKQSGAERRSSLERK